MIVDYHLHTGASPDGAGSFEDFIRTAVVKGVDEIGFTEHLLDRPTGSADSVTRPTKPEDFMDGYVEKFLEVKEDSALPIKLGAEVDFYPEEIAVAEKLVQRYPFDYVIGSVHFLDNWPIDSFSGLKEYFKRDIMQIYIDYFATIQKLCRTRLFDVLGHADIVKIFGFGPKDDITSLLETTSQAIADSNICVEVNTAGLIRPCAEIYPSKQFLKILRKLDVPVTLGSDAHKPEDVGRSFDKATDLMKEVGYTELCTFEKRKRKSMEI